MTLPLASTNGFFSWAIAATDSVQTASIKPMYVLMVISRS
jgi:hypothetical protein